MNNLINFFQDLIGKIDKLDERLDNVDKQLAVYNTQLGFHIEGVKQAKEENKLLREYVDIERQKLSERLSPLERAAETRKQYWKLAGKVLAVTSGLSGIIYSIYQILWHQ